MFRLASVELSNKRVLIVEGNADTASRMARDVTISGGDVIATVRDIAAMLAAFEYPRHIDCVMLDAHTLAQAPIFVPEWLQDRCVRLVVVTTWDDWFLNDEES